MRKLFTVLGVVVVVAVSIAYLLAINSLGRIVKAGATKIGPKVTQSRVELAEAQLSPLTGTASLAGLSVGNPAGWSDGRAFFLQSVEVDMDPWALLKDPLVIDDVRIDRPELNYETKIVSSNLQDLLKNIESYTGSPRAEKAETGTVNRKFIFKRVRISNAQATIGLGANQLKVTLPTMTLENLGVAENGITLSQLSSAIVREVLRNVATVAASSLSGATGAATLEKAKEAAKELGDKVESLFKKKP